jgi:transcriptional regulator with PAS, ATPase and Fis domain
VQGETGTGKGLVARVAHNCGPRANGPFIDVNCAAIPETMIEAELFGFEAGAFTDAKRAKPGLFESASGGTLFLDEIDALTVQTQPKLLKVIEDKLVRRLGAVADQHVDVKLIVATNADLLALVAEGRFREDLYQRLNLIAVTLPPLRERGQDVVVLAQYFLQRYAAAHMTRPKHLQAGAERWLERQHWPGNVRESLSSCGCVYG